MQARKSMAADPSVAYVGNLMSELTFEFFRMVELIMTHWNVYFDKFLAGVGQNWMSADVAYALAIQLLDIEAETCDYDIKDVPTFVHMKSMVQNVPVTMIESNWTKSITSELGDDLQVKIIDYDPETVRVSLGLKQLQSEPWEGIDEKYPIGSIVQGKVVNMMKYGAFVELEEGVEGLVHVSEMSWTRHIKHPTDLFKIGDSLEAKVLTVESSEKKISLGIKQLQDNPWDKIEEKYEVDSIHEGIVKNLTQYGAFVQLEEGVDGLVHISDMSWTEIVKHPKDVLNKGDKVKIKILDLSNQEHRLSLGIKQVTENPWENISEEYETGKKVKTTINEVSDKGATVKLENNLEGIVLFKSLSKDDKKQIKEIFIPNFELEVTVQEIDEELRKIIFIVDFSEYLKESTDLEDSE